MAPNALFIQKHYYCHACLSAKAKLAPRLLMEQNESNPSAVALTTRGDMSSRGQRWVPVRRSKHTVVKGKDARHRLQEKHHVPSSSCSARPNRPADIVRDYDMQSGA